MSSSSHLRTTAVLALLTAASALAAAKGAVDLTALQAASADRAAGVTRAATLSPLNWRYPFESAELWNAIGRNAEAAQHYREALRRFPGCAPCWIGLAEARAALREPADEALDKAVKFGRSMPEVRTRAAVLYAKMGERELAASEFSAALGGQKDEMESFYEMLHRIYSGDEILDRIVTSADLESYMNFALGNLPLRDTARVWQALEDSGGHTAWRNPYGGYLARHGHLRDAWSITVGTAGDEGQPLLDPGFGSGGAEVGFFGWHIRDVEGVRARISTCHDCESGARALRVRFDGERNVNYFGVSQAVPVLAGNRYALSARVRYDELSSARGPQIGVVGIAGSEAGTDCTLSTFAEELRGSSDWRETRVEFEIPAGCAGVKVLIARRQTPKLDRFVGGQLWVDRVDLQLLGRATEQARHKALAPPAARSIAG